MTDRIQIDWTNKGEVLDALDNWYHVMEAEVLDFLELAAELLRSRTAELTPTGSGHSQWGHLANAITAERPIQSSRGWQVNYGLPLGHAYGAVIEHGRKPGGKMPPLNAIAEWVWAKRYIFTDVRTEKDALRLAYPIARHIAKYGFTTAPDGQGQGWGMFRKAQEQSLDEVRDALQDARDRIVARINRRA